MSILLEFIFIIILFLIGYSRRMVLLSIMTILFTVISNIYIFQCVDGRSMFCQNGVYMVCVYDKVKIFPLTPAFLPIKYIPIVSVFRPTYGAPVVVHSKNQFILTRVIGMPLDTIKFADKTLYLNNEELQYKKIENTLYECAHNSQQYYKVINNIDSMTETSVPEFCLATTQDLRIETSKVDIVKTKPYIMLGAI